MAADEERSEVFLYNLTDMTGRKASASRSVVFFGSEMRRATRVAIFISAPIATFIALFSSYFLGEYALLVAVVAFGLSMLFLIGRQRRGMQLRYWEALNHKAKSRRGEFIRCGVIYDPLRSESFIVHRGSRPVQPSGAAGTGSYDDIERAFYV